MLLGSIRMGARMIDNVFDWVTETAFRMVATTVLFVVIAIGLIAGFFAGGTAIWRSHNTDPRVGTVWTGGTFSNTSEKCYGTNLIVTNDNGLAVINYAPECKGE